MIYKTTPHNTDQRDLSREKIELSQPSWWLLGSEYLGVSFTDPCEHLGRVNFVWTLVFAEEGRFGGLQQALAVFRRSAPVYRLDRVTAGDVSRSAANQLSFVHFVLEMRPVRSTVSYVIRIECNRFI